MADGVTFSVKSVEEQGNSVIVEIEGEKFGMMPNFVVKNRARLKAIRVVGVERLPRNVAEQVMEGDFGRVTEIIDFEERGGESGVGPTDVFALVEVSTGD